MQPAASSPKTGVLCRNSRATFLTTLASTLVRSSIGVAGTTRAWWASSMRLSACCPIVVVDSSSLAASRRECSRGTCCCLSRQRGLWSHCQPCFRGGAPTASIWAAVGCIHNGRL